MKNGTYLGIDFGTKRIGLAVGQSVTRTATPLTTIHNNPQSLQQFTKVIHEWEPKGLVIGLALQPDGSHSKTSLLAQKFGQKLKQQYQLPVFFTEERLTSVAARRSMQDERLAHVQDEDAMAAAIILESWLNHDPKE
jgi:putative Holliday junction resolvase